MKKWFLAVLVVLLVAVGISYAEFDVKKVTAALEYSDIEKDIDAVTLSGAYVETWGDFDSDDIESIGGTFLYEITDVNVKSILLNIGYDLSDTLKPYILIGQMGIEFNQNLSGTITENDEGDICTEPINVLTSNYDSDILAMGIGAKGNLVKIGENVDVSYDVRYIFGNNDDNANVTLFPGDECMEMLVGNTADVRYSELIANLILSQEIKMEDNKYIKGLTPYLGLRFSTAEINIKNKAVAVLEDDECYKESINAELEQTVSGASTGLILGIGAKINDNWSASLGGIIGQENGLVLVANYSF
jgi:hypothetical protein